MLKDLVETHLEKGGAWETLRRELVGYACCMGWKAGHAVKFLAHATRVYGQIPKLGGCFRERQGVLLRAYFLGEELLDTLYAKLPPVNQGNPRRACMSGLLGSLGGTGKHLSLMMDVQAALPPYQALPVACALSLHERWERGEDVWGFYGANRDVWRIGEWQDSVVRLAFAQLAGGHAEHLVIESATSLRETDDPLLHRAMSL